MSTAKVIVFIRETMKSNNHSPLPPLIKWAGGKRRLLPDIAELAPPKFSRYYEPFLGGGAVFFSLLPTAATLSDANDELIQMYAQVRDQPDKVLECLARMRNSEEDYYRIRSMKARTESSKAARLIYLCTLSFNGIYRQNLKGEFNVPYGYKTHIIPGDMALLKRISESLQGKILIKADFEMATSTAQKGDFVYFDPPYTVAHANNGFIKYNARIFSWEDQRRLASVASELKKAGCCVIVSNADHPSIRELYSGFEVRVIERQSVMAASSEFRRTVRECLFY
jgi:DNA adenine methylase